MTAGDTTVGETTVTGAVIVTGAIAAIGADPNGVMNAAIGGHGVQSAGKSAASGAVTIATCRGYTAAEHKAFGSMRDGFVDSRLNPVAIAGLSGTGR
ncbi:hypothetical protein [Rhizobium bangladeshense]|uniref:hypothetical protein n=1 Tax=Rhizobium bangladeshense TaxID=1138189 RepID=UPI00148652C7|nr:hypothetical protein [Rhizobium bangladeshense]MBY3598119.1 hypothetical protein [Rhizobium bangladeshense]